MPKEYKKRRVKKLGTKHKMQPIKDPKQLEKLLRYLLLQIDKATSEIKKFQAHRNYMIVLLGINTAFRAEDLLQLYVSEVIDGYMNIKEKKTGKIQPFRMTKELHNEIVNYINTWKLSNNDFMFKGQKHYEDSKPYFSPITKQRVYEIVTKACKEVGIDFEVGIHGLRKTFGYHYILSGGNIHTLVKMYNHDSVSTTELYVMWGIDDAQKERSSFFLGLKKR